MFIKNCGRLTYAVGQYLPQRQGSRLVLSDQHSCLSAVTSFTNQFLIAQNCFQYCSCPFAHFLPVFCVTSGAVEAQCAALARKCFCLYFPHCFLQQLRPLAFNTQPWQPFKCCLYICCRVTNIKGIVYCSILYDITSVAADLNNFFTWNVKLAMSSN